MFCPMCGVKLEDTAVFCGNCGYDMTNDEGGNETELLTEPVNFKRNPEANRQSVQQQQVMQESQQRSAYIPQQSVQAPVGDVQQPVKITETQKVKKPKEKKAKKDKKGKKGKVIATVLIVVLAVLLVLFGIVGLIASYFFVNEKATVKAFASNIEKQDMQAIYDMMFFEGDYVTFERFSGIYGADDFEAYNGEYTVVETSETEASKTFTVYYGNGAELPVEVVVHKDGFLFFDDYRMVIPSCVKYEINIPSDATAYIDGVAISSTSTQDTVTGLCEYSVYPLLPGRYTLSVMDAEGNSYEKYITVFGEEKFNTISLDSGDIKDGNIKKFAEEYDDEDVKAYFDKMMNEYIYASYEMVYYENAYSLTDEGISKLACNDYRVYTGYSYDSSLKAVTDTAKEGLKISDIMTEDEYLHLSDKSEGWAVYKVSELQKRIDNLWGEGMVAVEDILTAESYLTSKGFLLYDTEDISKGDYDYYGKVASVSTNDEGTITVDAYVLKCNIANKKIYDESTGLQVATAQINRGTSVYFDSIVNELKIKTAGMSMVRFTFVATDSGIHLLNATKSAVSKDVVQAQNAEVEEYTQTFYMKVKAGGGLNMRYEPTEKSKVIKLIPNGSKVEVLGYSSTVKSWVYVSYGGYEGWVNSAYLISNDYNSQPSGEIYWYRVKADGGLNMRKSDSQKSKVIKLIPDKSVVKFINYNEDATWAYVSYNETYEGWVSAKYLEYAYSTDY